MGNGIICSKCGREREVQLRKPFRKLKSECEACYEEKKRRLGYMNMKLIGEREERMANRLPLNMTKEEMEAFW